MAALAPAFDVTKHESHETCGECHDAKMFLTQPPEDLVSC